jgi:hypothetical protein
MRPLSFSIPLVWLCSIMGNYKSAANLLFPTARSRIRDPGWLLREHLLTMNPLLEEMAAMLGSII